MHTKGVLFAMVCFAAVLVIGVLAACGNSGNGNLTINLDKIEKLGTRWLFHFTVQNNGSVPTTVIGSGPVDQFVLDGMAPPRTPESQATRTLSAPDQTYSPSHPRLARSVGASQRLQGWLEANLTGFPYQPYQVEYRFGTVQTTGCSNIRDKSTCHPATLFRIVVWELS
jgi:hypothetical protein